MPGYCRPSGPPLFARKAQDLNRLPDPSPPPWADAARAPASFYRVIYPRGVGHSAFALLASAPAIIPEEGEQ